MREDFPRRRGCTGEEEGLGRYGTRAIWSNCLMYFSASIVAFIMNGLLWEP